MSGEPGGGELGGAELGALVEVTERSVVLAVTKGHVWVPRPEDYPPALRERGAAFVTLREDGRLRGCIGTLVAVDSLVVTVADRARAAALDDPRFPPVSRRELADLDVSVSVLSPMRALPVAGYEDLLGKVRPGVDGLMIQAVYHAATFLPSVWEELPEPAEFLAHLWLKARLTPGAWPDGMAVFRYTAQHAGRGARRG